MAIKYTIVSLDEVEEALRGNYKQGDDGKYHLDIDGVSVNDLVKTNSELSERLKQTQSQLKAIEANTQDAEKKRLEEAQQFEQLYRTEQAEKARLAAELQAMREQTVKEVRERKATEFASLVTKNPAQQKLLIRELLDHIQQGDDGQIVTGGLLAGDVETVKSQIAQQYPFLCDAVQSSGGGATGGVSAPTLRKYSEYTTAELSEIQRTNPAEYDRLRQTR